MSAPLSYPAAPRPAPVAPAAAAATELPVGTTGCAICGVRKYCARYSAANLCPPANCPFGLGPAGS